MRANRRAGLGEKEPTAAALAAIEGEWPVIAAELELVDVECRLARTPADPLASRAHRRAVRSLLALLAQHNRTTHHISATGTRPDAA